MNRRYKDFIGGKLLYKHADPYYIDDCIFFAYFMKVYLFHRLPVRNGFCLSNYLIDLKSMMLDIVRYIKIIDTLPNVGERSMRVSVFMTMAVAMIVAVNVRMTVTMIGAVIFMFFYIVYFNFNMGTCDPAFLGKHGVDFDIRE